MGFLPCKESMGGTLPRGNQKGRSAQANEKLCSIQNNEKSCSAQKNVATERTILESGGHQVRTVITLEPGSEVRRRRVKENRNRDREGLRLSSGENSRKLRQEIGQKVTEGRMRRTKDVEE